MWRWRLAIAIVLLTVLGGPLIVPFVDLATNPAAWSAWRDTSRILSLTSTTAGLVAGVLAIDLPLGTALAILLYRSDMGGRTLLRRMVVVSLFVPLPLMTSAWQSTLGGAGWLGPPNPSWPWATGFRAAVWVHAAAGLPWVIWLVGQGLCWVEPEIEEDALLAAAPSRVLFRVTLPRARGAILAAAAWVTLLTAHEITVTDLTQVRTFAEEVYTQFALPDATAGMTPELGIARAVAVTLPGTLVVASLLGLAVWRWERAVPPLGTAPQPRPLIRLGPTRLPAFGVVATVVAIFGVVPIGSLVWRLGAHGYPEQWSPDVAGQFIQLAERAHARLIGGSLAAAAVTGLAAAVLALISCWLARDSRSLRLVLTAIVALAWATPGPVVGAGLKTTIEKMVDLESNLKTTIERIADVESTHTSDGPVRQFLYNGPSPLPVVWANLIRLFPFAVALVWPVVRLVPSALTDAARVDGAPPAVELRHAVWPLSAAAVGRAAVATGVLALGELSASKMVATPGEHLFGATFAHVVWARMHYGVNNQLAALCLLLLAVAIPPTALLMWFVPRSRSNDETL
jgi:iron(III) transport system permease protein